MKTNLNRTISTHEEAEAFLNELFENDEVFNPDDSAHDVIWDNCEQPPTAEECNKLNILMNAVWEVANDDFDPHAYLLDLLEEEERRMRLARPNEGY